MAQAVCDEAEFIELFESLGASQTARRLGIGERNVYERRRNIELRLGRTLNSPDTRRSKRISVTPIEAPGRLRAEIETGVVVVGGDAHYWPGDPSTAHRAFVRFCKEMKPTIVVMNGDVLDGSTISRHAPIGWESRPSLIQEIEACKDRLGDITIAAGKARRVWTLGNHDARFETRLATIAPEYARVNGVALHDHFPDWEPCWSLFINDDVVVKHRLKGGVHATHNNTMWAGKTIVTNHLHSQKVTPLTDYNGTRWGVDTGCLAEIYAPAFQDYLEDGPRSWRAGFGVLTFVDGMLLQPELVRVIDAGRVDFRGKVYSV